MDTLFQQLSEEIILLQFDTANEDTKLLVDALQPHHMLGKFYWIPKTKRTYEKLLILGFDIASYDDLIAMVFSSSADGNIKAQSILRSFFK